VNLAMPRAFLAFVAGLFALASPAAETPRPPGPPPAEALFTDGRIRTFKITIEEPELSKLKKNERAYVRATVHDGERAYPKVGVHLKGMGSFQPFHAKPSLAVNFDQFVDGNYHGLDKFFLNNSGQDGTFLAEYMATRMFRDAGVPAARVTHAFVELNGRAVGLYVLIEAMNKDFLRQHFGSPKGNLYEAYLADIDGQMDQDGGPDTTQADVKALLDACRLPETAARWSRLQQLLEVDKFISLLVCEMFTAHTDGYAMNRNNYRIYNDPTTGRFTFITHGLDWGYANTGVGWRPPENSIVVRAVLGTPEGRRLYAARARELFTNVFRLDVLTNRVNEVVTRLVAHARHPGEAKEFQNHGAEMRRRLVARAAHLEQQFSLPEPEPLKFDARGQARVAGWQPRQQEGAPEIERRRDGDKTLLRIKAPSGGCVASWRTQVLLPAGKYRFTGRARAARIEPGNSESGIGAGVRISGDKRANQLRGDADWTELAHDFDVASDGEMKELVCELRARKGEVWFDADSLRLQRR
jgi:spore coat protein CotH